MEALSFEARVRRDNVRVAIDLQGELNSAADQELNKAFTEAQKSNPAIILLNFTNVSYINSTGIALVVGVIAQAQNKHQKLVVYGLSDHYVRIFQITRLADFLEIATDETSALAKLSEDNPVSAI